MPAFEYHNHTSKGWSARPRVTWPETPLPEHAVTYLPGKMAKRLTEGKKTTLTESDLREILETIELAETRNIGDFTLPDYDDLKVKFAPDTGLHYIEI